MSVCLLHVSGLCLSCNVQYHQAKRTDAETQTGAGGAHLFDTRTRPAESALLSSFRNCMNAWNVAAAAARPLPSGCAPSPCIDTKLPLFLAYSFMFTIKGCQQTVIKVTPTLPTDAQSIWMNTHPLSCSRMIELVTNYRIMRACVVGSSENLKGIIGGTKEDPAMAQPQ